MTIKCAAILISQAKVCIRTSKRVSLSVLAGWLQLALADMFAGGCVSLNHKHRVTPSWPSCPPAVIARTPIHQCSALFVELCLCAGEVNPGLFVSLHLEAYEETCGNGQDDMSHVHTHQTIYHC